MAPHDAVPTDTLMDYSAKDRFPPNSPGRDVFDSPQAQKVDDPEIRRSPISMGSAGMAISGSENPTMTTMPWGFTALTAVDHVVENPTQSMTTSNPSPRVGGVSWQHGRRMIPAGGVNV